MPQRIKRALSAFLVQSEPAKAAPLAPFDYEKVRKELLASGEDHAAAIHERLPPELADPVLELFSRQVQTLLTNQPRRLRQNLVDTEVLPPTPQALSRFRRQWEVATDPMIALRDMAEHALSPDQVTALETLWPALTKAMRSSVLDAAMGLKASRPSWEPTTRQDQQIRCLRGQPKFDPQLASMIQQSLTPPQPQQKQPEKKVSLGADQAITAGQKAEQTEQP